MAKQPKKQTPLRQVRLASGLGQKEFADRVGIGFQLYNKLERGVTPLTQANAYKVYQESGVAMHSIQDKNSGGALTGSGQPYSAAAWKVWQPWAVHLEEDAWWGVKDVLGWVHLACDIAYKKKRLRQFRAMLLRALNTCLVDCGLRPATKQRVQSLKQKFKVKFTYGELRRNASLAKQVGFRDGQYRDGQIVTDDETWEAVLTKPIYWNPQGWFLKELAETLKPLLDGSPYRTTFPPITQEWVSSRPSRRASR